MSLQHLAQNMAAHGRNGDSMLVHMTPNEVQHLQKNMQAHGRELTINPHTGLPEAWFGSDLGGKLWDAGSNIVSDVTSNPIGALALGAALGPAGFALMSSGMAAATVGGLAALSTGSLSKGLQAGMAAYGGANLSAGLSSMGENAIAQGAADQSAAESARLGLDQAAYDVAGQEAAANASTMSKLGAGADYAVKNPQAALAALGEGSALKGAGVVGAAALPILAGNMVPTATPAPSINGQPGLIRPYTYNRSVNTVTLPGQSPLIQSTYQPGQDTSERNWFQDRYTALTPYTAPGPEYKKMAGGGAVEQMSNANAIGENTGYPQADINQGAYATPWQTPISRNMVTDTADTGVDQITGEENRFAQGGITALASGGYTGYNGFTFNPLTQTFDVVQPANNAAAASTGIAAAVPADSYGTMPRFAYDPKTQTYAKIEPPKVADTASTTTTQPTEPDSTSWTDYSSAGAAGGLPSDFQPRMAAGGLGSLGGYSDGGRLLKGPGDGMSDNIPAQIGNKQPARLADGEFVVPADVVSHLGNGSTDAGAKQLYKMMDRIRQQRTGKKKQAPEVNPTKAMPA